MPDTDSLATGGQFAPGVPPPTEPYPVKGCGGLDWGIRSRLAIQAVGAIVHRLVKPQAALDQYLTARPGHGQHEEDG